MASRFHAARQRRAERLALLTDELNLVPLVDVLVSILFFSLLSYTGAVGLLTSFDLRLPPVVVTRSQVEGMSAESVALLLVVRIQENMLLVEHTGGGGFRREITGGDDAALEQFGEVMSEIKQEYPNNDDVLVIPDDATNYERVVGVLEQLKIAQFDGISLGTRARATRVAAATRR